MSDRTDSCAACRNKGARCETCREVYAEGVKRTEWESKEHE